MKKNIKRKMVILITIFSMLAGLILYLYLVNMPDEYVPEEEISREELKNVQVEVFFESKENNQLEAEIRNVSSKDILLNPYETLLNILLEEPENPKLEKIIPDGMKIENIKLKDYCLSVEFSNSENIANEEIKLKIKESIEKTLTQLNEIANVKIIINGVEI